MHRLFLLTLGYAEGKFWDKYIGIMHLENQQFFVSIWYFFQILFFFENFSCVYGVTVPRIVVSNVVLWYR